MNVIKKVLCVIMTAVLLFTAVPLSDAGKWLSFEAKAALPPLAATGQCGDKVFWEFDEETGELIISGEGDMYSYDFDNDSPFSSYDSIKSVTVCDGVTSISGTALYACMFLTTVNFGNTVTSIGEDAFSFCYNLDEITIPNSVTEIKANAFSCCNKLTSVNIPENVSSISVDSFWRCAGLTEITVDESNEYYTSIDGVLFSKDETVLMHYPAGIPSASYEIPDSVTTITDYTFYECFNLTEIYISENVTEIGEWAVSNETLSAIIVDEDNPVYSNDDCGVLFNKDKTVIYQYPQGNTCEMYIIPDTVTTIVEYAFYSPFYLTDIIIPSGITEIETNAFLSCNLISAHYCGTPEQYNNMSISESNTRLLNVLHINTDEDKDSVCDICFYSDGGYTPPAYEENDINPGDSITIYDMPYYEKCYFFFTPTVSGTYTFFSASKKDMCGAIYSEKGALLTENDDASAFSSDFSISYYLQSGSTYLLGVAYSLSESSAGPFTVTLILEDASEVTSEDASDTTATQPPVTTEATVTTTAAPAEKATTAKQPSAPTPVITTPTTEKQEQPVVKAVKPAKVKIKKPSSKKKKQILVIWNAVKDAEGYQIFCSENKKFTKKSTKTKLIKKSKTTKATFKKLKSGKKYFIKIRAYKNANGKKLYGAYSKVMSVKVK